ncbi:YslB family protein [Desertibacillus haloalkaliphilus]|uniref:YslB family protein n=1 Tax=Desertibacillus haloalkaliphilus TaxID=1328930 RepID=UPI001C25CEB1|nr:YslB family protein [Desertibacillus haloalkaliphilus]MBU8905103.1 YslB family protein [Desertibacillus haloalkaliphilus]
MSKHTPLDKNVKREASSFGYQLLRADVLANLLGKEQEQILYWAGKSLARKYKLSSIDEVIVFFNQADWGTLAVIKEKKTEMMFQLTDHLYDESHPYSVQLEAGFLAEQIQQIKSRIAETTVKQKKATFVFTVQWDHKDEV